MRHVFAQDGTDIRLEWGVDGVAALGKACGVLVIVDVLSFTTTVDIAVSRGAKVRPMTWTPDSPYHLRRPVTALEASPGAELTMGSPNGATLCVAAEATGATVFAGCLRNAAAVAARVAEKSEGAPIGVIAAGERWGISLAGTGGKGTLRPCVEDHLGAGAVVAALLDAGAGKPSPEAQLAATVFRATDLPAAVANCVSGRELAEGGSSADIELAVQVGCSITAPELDGGVFTDRP